MVATRRSLPNVSSDAEDEDELPLPQSDEMEQDIQNKRVRNALRKLHIDGTAALTGDRVDRRETTGTYHYRGAVYDITADTPQMWIDQQPMRYRRSESETRSISRNKPITRRSLADGHDGPGEEDDEDGTRPAKRTRHSMPGPSTRTRRQSQILERTTRHTRSSTAMNKVAEDRQRQLRERKRRNSDFTTHQRSGLMEKIAVSRDVARGKGYDVEPLADSDMRDEKMQWRRRLATTLIRLGKVNSRVARLSAMYRSMKERGEFDELLPSRHDTAMPDGAGSEENKGEGEEKRLEMAQPADTALQAYASPASASQQARDDENPGGCALSPTAAPGTADEPPLRIDSPSMNSVKNHSPSPTVDVPGIAMSIEHEQKPGIDSTDANDIPAEPVSEPDEAVDQQIHEELALSVDSTSRAISLSKPSSEPPAARPHPKPAEKPSETSARARSSHWIPKLSDKLKDGERAENAIHQDRRRSETAQAWRRRVQREVALVRSWPVSDTLPKLIGDAGGGEDVTAAIDGGV